MRLPVIAAALAITALVGVSMAETLKYHATGRDIANSPSVMTHLGAPQQANVGSAVQPRAGDAGYKLSLFDRPEVAPASPGAVSPSAPAPKLSIAFAPSDSSPVEGYAFTGTVCVNGVDAALIEDKKTGEGVYVHTGDPFQGGVVGEISPTQITIHVGGHNWTIARNEVFSVVPLTDSAAVADNESAAPTTEETTQDLAFNFAAGDAVDMDDTASVGDTLAWVGLGDDVGQVSPSGVLQLSNVTISFDNSSGAIQMQMSIGQPAPGTEGGWQVNANSAQDMSSAANSILNERLQEAQAEQQVRLSRQRLDDSYYNIYY